MSNLKNVQPLEDFNWDEFENGTNVNANCDDLAKMYDETLNKVSEHQVTEGTVISIADGLELFGRTWATTSSCSVSVILLRNCAQ